MSALLNGHRRPSLNDQINRLDRILDGLADGLNEAVAAAVRTAVAEAVREATVGILHEVLLNPELRSLVAAAESAPAKPTLRERCRSWWQRCCARIAVVGASVAVAAAALWQRTSKIGHRMINTAQSTARRYSHRAADRALATCATTRSLVVTMWQSRATIIPASAVGLIVTLGTFLAGPTVASALCGLSAGCLTFLYATTIRAIRWAQGIRLTA